MNSYKIDEREQMINGSVAKYRLEQGDDGGFIIAIKRGSEEVAQRFAGDFLEIVGLYKTMVETYTLPENLEDLKYDWESCAIL